MQFWCISLYTCASCVGRGTAFLAEGKALLSIITTAIMLRDDHDPYSKTNCRNRQMLVWEATTSLLFWCEPNKTRNYTINHFVISWKPHVEHDTGTTNLPGPSFSIYIALSGYWICYNLSQLTYFMVSECKISNLIKSESPAASTTGGKRSFGSSFNGENLGHILPRTGIWPVLM